jgi:glycerol-3-phosphate dehydrogenase
MKTGLSIFEQGAMSERHGPEALQIIKNFGNNKTYHEYEALHAIENTMCMNLLDYFTRRVPLMLSANDHGFKYLDSIAEVFRASRGLTSAEIEEQKNQVKHFIKTEFNWKVGL